MDDALGVGPRQGLADLDREADGSLRREPTLSQDVAQLVAADQLHRDEADAFDFVDLVNHGDVGMLEGRGGLRFLHEAPFPVRVLHQLGGQDLEGELAVQP